jgi:drug/metabolite transporter (DMT)-like permease
MEITRIGELAALSTAVFWTVTVLSFEYAGKRVGALSLNLLRLTLGFIFLSLFSLVTRGMLFPADASPGMWFWLGLSGFVGFVVGDIFLFRAFIEIGARISMLIYASVPPLSAVLGWMMLGEVLTPAGFIGMGITIFGIALVILQRGKKETGSGIGFSHPVRGILFAFGGSLGQAGGLVLSKYGAGDYNAFAATQIRCLAGIAGFTAVILFLKRGSRIVAALKDKPAMKRILLGSFFGPFLGVSLGLYAVQHTSTGIASTIMAIVPVLIIPPSVVLFGEKVTVKEAAGALTAVAGVAFLFLF